MAGRRRRARHDSASAAFRPSAPTGAGRTPSRAQLIALLCGLVLVASGVAVASYLVKPAKARSFDLFYGSVYIDDNTSPVAIDLASGKPTVRLSNAFTAVSAKTGTDIDVYPLGGGNTLLLDPHTGEFNMVDATGFVVKSSDGGVPLPRSGASTTAMAVPSGSDAYIVRGAPSATSIYLVSASTVSSAIGSQSKTKARAYASIKAPLSGDPASAAEANGELWLLTGGAGRIRSVTQLSVPTGSNPGVTLDSTTHGTVTGPAAIGAATTNADGTGGDVPAAASADEIRVFRGSAQTDIPVSVGAGVDTILPATDAQGTLVFLYHATSGWSRVSVPAAAGTKAVVTKLDAIPSAARLAAPAQSDGRTYTMDTSGQGALWQIDAAGTAHDIPGAPSYPLKTGERPELADAQVVAQGSRVIFNSRANLQAEVVFSDGSHDPRTIFKHDAVQVDPSGATALADAHAKPSTQPGKNHKPTKTIKRPTQTINDKINCKVAKQVPRVPTLVAGDRAARSIGLTWTYDRLDPSDCYPSTYVVDIKVLSSGAPSPPSGQVTVQGQNGVTLTQLFPATEYELTVTAYINTQHTSSAPIRVTTGPEGPAAPTDVRASTDSSGNWTVSWNSCGGVKQGCVATTTWNLLPAFCDGRGLSNVPAKVTFPGDPTVHSFTHVYAGGSALLGRALCFSIQGVSPQGTIGTTSAPSAPAYSWAPPDAAAMTLAASQPGDTAFGSTTSTTVDLDLGADPVQAVGGLGATITLRLSGPDGIKSKTITWDGRTERVSTVFTGVRAGAQYTATASIAPPHHAGSAVTKGPVTVTTRAEWPAITAQASCPTGSGAVTLSCTLVVQLSGPSSAQASGEHFDVVDSGVVCGNSGFALSGSHLDPSRDAITQSVDLLQYNGTCTVNVHLVESTGGTRPEVFGGTTSPLISRSVDLGHASTLDSSDTFSADWTTNPTGYARVRYTGSKSDAEVASISQGWAEQLLAPGGTVCGSSDQQPTHDGILVPVSSNCVDQFGDQSGWSVTISYVDRGTGNQHSRSVSLSGGPPGYVPCSVNGSFGATWVESSDFTSPEVTVHYDGSAGDNLDGCGSWTYQLQHLQDCSRAGNGDPRNGDITLTATCGDDPNTPGWTVSISWNDPAGRGHGRLAVVGGTPPASPTPDPDPTPTTPDPSSSSS